MQRITAVFIFILITVALYGYETDLTKAHDFIRDDYTETNAFSVHSEGLITYGAHTNTLHLRYAYLRANYNIGTVQLFATLKGYKDTHDPPVDYQYILNNVGLFDYGVRFLFWDHFLVSLRGASSYPLSRDTYLMVPHTYYDGNPGEFDTPEQYLPDQMSAAGVRVGYYSDTLQIGYAQGDWRHIIPRAVMVKYTAERFGIRGLFQHQCVDAEDWISLLQEHDFTYQLTLTGSLPFGAFNLYGVAELTVSDFYTTAHELTYWVRLEQALEWNRFVFALRELLYVDSDGSTSFLFEGSVSRWFYDAVELGVFASTDGRIYVGTRVSF